MDPKQVHEMVGQYEKIRHAVEQMSNREVTEKLTAAIRDGNDPFYGIEGKLFFASVCQRLLVNPDMKISTLKETTNGTI